MQFKFHAEYVTIATRATVRDNIAMVQYDVRYVSSAPTQRGSRDRFWSPRVIPAYYTPSSNLVDFLPLPMTFCAFGAKSHGTGKNFYKGALHKNLELKYVSLEQLCYSNFVRNSVTYHVLMPYPHSNPSFQSFHVPWLHPPQHFLSNAFKLVEISY